MKWPILLLGLLCLTTEASAQIEAFSKSRGLSFEEFSKVIRDVNPNIVVRNGPESRSATTQSTNLDLRLDPRIVGGEPVEIKDYPWQVALIFGTAPDPVRVQFCGGSLIRPKWVLTAAHCVDRNTTAEKVNIVANTAYYKHGGNRVKVKSIKVHEGWNPSTNENDIAIVELASDLPTASIVALADSDLQIPDSSKVTITGWGAIAEGGRGSEILLGADIPTVSNSVCAIAYPNTIKAGMLCAGLRDGGLDSCQGDSGGPAVLRIGGTPTLAGVVSFGEGCARQKRYGVYTRVSHYRTWIDAILKSR